MAKTYMKVILAGAAGLAAGMAVGFLIAPAKGSKTRKRLRKKILEMEDKIKAVDLTETFNEIRTVFTGEGDKDVQ